jgi:hypothetical protein
MVEKIDKKTSTYLLHNGEDMSDFDMDIIDWIQKEDVRAYGQTILSTLQDGGVLDDSHTIPNVSHYDFRSISDRMSVSA